MMVLYDGLLYLLVVVLTNNVQTLEDRVIVKIKINILRLIIEIIVPFIIGSISVLNIFLFSISVS